jgi:hypothetical protein
MTTKAVKAFAGFEIKNEERGEIEAIIATLGVVDRDGDILRKGSIPHGTAVAMSGWGHDAVFGSRPVGKGTIYIDGNKAVFKGRVFLNTAAGRETFEVLKELPTEWSWGFHVVNDESPNEAERKAGARRILTKTAPFEVSPVIIGAGIGTGTVAVKQADGDGDVVEPVLEAAIEDAAPTGRIEDLFIDIDALNADAERKSAEEAEVKAAQEAEATRLAAESAAVASEFDRITRNMRKWA